MGILPRSLASENHRACGVLGYSMALRVVSEIQLFGTTPACDGQTDGRTDGHTDTRPQHVPR